LSAGPAPWYQASVRSLLALAVLAGLLLVPRAEALNCKKFCGPSIRKCIRQECSPPDFNVPRKACIIGIRGGAIASCKAIGKKACPRKRCPIPAD
jgi:hypothetical protein